MVDILAVKAREIAVKLKSHEKSSADTAAAPAAAAAPYVQYSTERPSTTAARGILVMAGRDAILSPGPHRVPRFV